MLRRQIPDAQQRKAAARSIWVRSTVRFAFFSRAGRFYFLNSDQTSIRHHVAIVKADRTSKQLFRYVFFAIAAWFFTNISDLLPFLKDSFLYHIPGASRSGPQFWFLNDTPGIFLLYSIENNTLNKMTYVNFWHFPWYRYICKVTA